MVGFGQEGFFSLQDVTFMHLWCLIWSSIYNVRTDLIGSPGSSCLPDVLKLGFGPVFEEKSPHFLVLWRPLIMRMRKEVGIFALSAQNSFRIYFRMTVMTPNSRERKGFFLKNGSET